MSDKNDNSFQRDSSLELELEWIELKEQMSRGKYGNEEKSLSRVWSKCKENPFVPIGVSATTFCLAYGLLSMRRGDSQKQQLMMRGRILAQGFTVMALVSGIMFSLVNKVKQS